MRHEESAPTFEPAPALGHRHVQTFWGRLTRPRLLVPLRREVLSTPDGDELILDHLDGPAGAPRVVLLHGLEGSAHSCYVQGLLAQLAARGLRAVALNFRSCARDLPDLGRNIPNRTPRLYHSGETADFDHLVKSLVAAEPGVAHAAIGVSLGGNVLLKWLGENPGQAHVAAAATISVPYDLEAGARKLEQGLGPVYTATFLRGLRRKTRQLLRRHPEVADRFDAQRMRSARTFFAFDDAVTAPLHGFRSAKHYYDTSSSLNWVGRITTPTLCLSAEDDPFLPSSVLDRVAANASGAVRLVATRHGGHTGFIGGTSPLRVRYWAEERAAEFVAARLARSRD
ncbi:MAG: alpha/beta fold hydrolase [Holophagales bacterium]|nr:alpha/beta fold hydrolase [Holophagales bacterium]